jgi:hypothetical protein
VRKDFLSAFEEIMAQAFTSRFAGYADTKFEVASVQVLNRAGQFKVRSRILTGAFDLGRMGESHAVKKTEFFGKPSPIRSACQFFFGDLSILTVPSRHADAYDLACFRMG